MMHPWAVFLERADARRCLVDAGEMGLDEAFAGLVPAFEAIMDYDICNTCGAAPCVDPSFCESCRRADAVRKKIRPLARLLFLRRLLADDISLERAWRELQPRATATAAVREAA